MSGRPHLTPDDIRDIKASRAAGETFSSIARRLGCSPSTVKHHIAPQRRSLTVAKCPGCPMLFLRPHHGRVYCTTECFAAHRTRKNQQAHRDFLDDLERIAPFDTWESIARRLGYKNPKSLARRLHEIGEGQWAKEIERVAQYAQAA